MIVQIPLWLYDDDIPLIQKTLSKEKQKAHKPRLQGKMGIFETSLTTPTPYSKDLRWPVKLPILSGGLGLRDFCFSFDNAF